MNESKFVMIDKTMQGRRHADQEKNNQDYVLVKITERYILLSVNDGCSGCDYPEQAAYCNAVITEQIAENRALWSMDEKHFKKAVSNIFRNQLAETGYPMQELCSTIAFVIIDKANDNFIAFSVGDSAVLVMDEKLRFRQLLKPINGMRKNQTVFTNDTAAVAKLSQYSKGKLSTGIAGFLLYTDGAETLANAPYDEAVQLTAAMILGDKTGKSYANNLMAQLREVNSDDISFAAVAVKNEITLAAANANFNGKILSEETEEFCKSNAAPDASNISAECRDTTEQKTRRARLPFTNHRKTVHAASLMLPSVLIKMRDPLTAAEMMQQIPEITETNFFEIMIVLIRLGIVTVNTQNDGHITFRTTI